MLRRNFHVSCFLHSPISLHESNKVRESGKKSLKDVRSVVRNPEVAGLSEVLLAALVEPAKHTKAAVEALLVCEFVHSIDAPSLALLVPVLQRAMRERSGDVKRKGETRFTN